MKNKYYINVADYMPVKLPRPSKKKDFVMDENGKLPVICVECEI